MAKDEHTVRNDELPADVSGPGHGTVEPAPSPAPSPAPERKIAPSRKSDVTLDAYEQVKHTRSAALWSSLIGGALVLLLLLGFIVQNLQNTEITLLFWKANLPLGVSLLIAAIAGALLVGLAGALRIVQLRRAAKKLQD